MLACCSAALRFYRNAAFLDCKVASPDLSLFFSIYGICFAFFHKKSLPKNDIIHILFKIFDKIFILVLTKSDMRCIMCANKLKGKPGMRRTLNFAYAFYYYFYDRSNRIL